MANGSAGRWGEMLRCWESDGGGGGGAHLSTHEGKGARTQKSETRAWRLGYLGGFET
jgi:hypothetical protein